MKTKPSLILTLCALAALQAAAQSGPNAAAQGGNSTADDAEVALVDMAQKLANPIGAMISVPFQSNLDFGGGPDGDGFQFKMNLQPIILFPLNDD